jgi:hypothetical protein
MALDVAEGTESLLFALTFALLALRPGTAAAATSGAVSAFAFARPFGGPHSALALAFASALAVHGV